MKKLFLGLILLSSILLIQTDLSACKGHMQACDVFNHCCEGYNCGFLSMGGTCVAD